MAYLYTYTCIDMILYFKKYIWNIFFPRFILPFVLVFTFFLPTINQWLFHYLQFRFFISVDISKVYVMSSTTSQSSPSFHSFLNTEKTSVETATKINFISSIWDDDHIMRLDEKNWQRLWCNKTFQGINATTDLSHVLGKKVIHIKSCYVA